MQDVGEHMDDLFRNAADGYMLKEGESNWNNISGRLTSASPVKTGNQYNKTKKYIGTGILLLLCFAAGILLDHYTPTNAIQVIPTALSSGKDADDNVAEDLLLNKYKEKQQDKVASEAHTNNNSLSVHKNFNPGLKELYHISTKNYLTYSGRIGTNNPPVFDALTDQQQTLAVPKDNATGTVIKVPQLLATLTNKTIIVGETVNKDSTANIPEHKPTLKNKSGIYYGILAGAGLTTVKRQDFTRPGFDLGLVAGYQFTTKISTEINLLYSRKYYYSDGQYFNTAKMVGMPEGMKVQNVKGSSAIFEIPVKLKYNILQKNKSVIYASAGVSSYILVHEKNEYTTSLNGTIGSMKGNYKTTTGYFAGAINLSAGYQYNIGQNNTLRIEPYITIPTKGIGIGSLPVTTSGVHVLFTIAPHK